MKINNSRFVTSLSKYSEYPGMGLPEICVTGKSNVGKSSFINKLCMNYKLAKVSSAPGKTRLINIFAINDEIFLIDLPGYGFARASKSEQQRWGDMVNGYLNGSDYLSHIIHLVDIRHEPTNDDKQMNAWLRSCGVPFTVIATKADKISRGAIMKQKAMISRAFQIQPWDIIEVSNQSGYGMDKVLDKLDEMITAEQ